MPPARIVVFVDYENVHRSALDCFWPRGTGRSAGHLDPLRLGRLLVARRTANGLPSALAGVRVYRGRPNSAHQPIAAAANDRQADEWSRSPSVTVVRRPLRYPRSWPAEPAVEKGIDVALAVDIVRLAGIEDTYDVGIVFSGDTDLLPALEAVLELRCGHLEVAAWKGGSKRLRFDGTSRPWCHWLDEADYAQVVDPIDYTKPRR